MYFTTPFSRDDLQFIGELNSHYILLINVNAMTDTEKPR